MKITPQHIAVLKLMEDGGAYGSEIPDDDVSSDALSDCEQMGLIHWESARMNDFYYLTKAGIAALAAAPPS